MITEANTPPMLKVFPKGGLWKGQSQLKGSISTQNEMDIDIG